MLTMMSGASTAHDVTNVDKDINGATKLWSSTEQSKRMVKGGYGNGLKWLEFLKAKRD